MDWQSTVHKFQTRKSEYTKPKLDFVFRLGNIFSGKMSPSFRVTKMTKKRFTRAHLPVDGKKRNEVIRAHQTQVRWRFLSLYTFFW